MSNNYKAIVGITGSCGKTTTRELTAKILSTRWKVFKNHENGNDAWFIKQYLKKLEQTSYDALVLEYGLRTPDCIRDCCQVIQPEIAVITNIGTAHLGNFKSDTHALVKAKAQIFHNLSPNGLLLLNADEPHSAFIDLEHFKGTLIKVSIENPSDYRAQDIHHDEQGIRFTVTLRQVKQSIHVNLLGRHNIYNVLFSIAIADRLGFTPEEIQSALISFCRVTRRLEYHHLVGNNHLIDDSFNSSPEANIAAINVLSEIGIGRKIAVFGSMLDQKDNPEAYCKIGRHLVDKIDMLHTLGCDEVGPDAKIIGDAAIAAGFPESAVRHHDNQETFKQWLIKNWSSNNTFLVKGTLTYQIAFHIRRYALLREIKRKLLQNTIQ